MLEQAFIPVPTLLPGCCQHSLGNALGTSHQLDTCVGRSQNPPESGCLAMVATAEGMALEDTRRPKV